MTEASLDALKAKDTRFVADWLKSKGLHKLCSVFEGIQEPFALSSAQLLQSFRSIIEATEKFPGAGAFDHLEWNYNGAFELFGLGRGEFEQKFSQKFKCPGVCLLI